MPQSSTIVLIPLLSAILLYFSVFYIKEKAIDKGSRNFILACVSILALMSFLVLRVLEMLGPTGTVAYAIVGVLLLVGALVSTRL